MAMILVYTSPARGHLFPITGAALGSLPDQGLYVVATSSAILMARSMKKRAERIAAALAKAGGYPALADSFEELLLREKEAIVLKK